MWTLECTIGLIVGAQYKSLLRYCYCYFDVVCVMWQVMKRLMHVSSDFWLRYVNVDEEFDGDDQHSGLPAQSQG